LVEQDIKSQGLSLQAANFQQMEDAWQRIKSIP
jgi:hypothetical protein